MLLIADSGSTKTEWCLVDPSGKETYFNTEGYNPYFADEQYILQSIKDSLPTSLDRREIGEVHFYGSGCQEDKVQVMEDILRAVFTCAGKLAVEEDLLAAARGLLCYSEGFAAIMGTGSNTCTYNGREITQNIDSYGYVLGDEGSGATIGKKILVDFLRGKMPESTRKIFSEKYHLGAGEVLHKVYKEPQANRFCAGFVKFLDLPEVDRDYADNLVKAAFREFFREVVTCYPGYTGYTFNCIGSIGYHFRKILEEVAGEYNMKTGRIIRSLIRDLVKYHFSPAGTDKNLLHG